jgi:hypothetical protein
LKITLAFASQVKFAFSKWIFILEAGNLFMQIFSRYLKQRGETASLLLIVMRDRNPPVSMGKHRG